MSAQSHDLETYHQIYEQIVYLRNSSTLDQETKSEFLQQLQAEVRQKLKDPKAPPPPSQATRVWVTISTSGTGWVIWQLRADHIFIVHKPPTPTEQGGWRMAAAALPLNKPGAHGVPPAPPAHQL